MKPSSGVPGLTDETEIGRGGFGIVYRATETELGRTVAVKVLQPPRHEHDWERFDRERRTLAAVSDHPNIVTVYRTGRTTDDRPYLVMEYCRQGSLADELSARGPLVWRKVLDVAIEMCDALDTAHRAGIVHRDLKPANILMSNHDEPLLADFGIAEVAGAEQAEPDDGYLTVSLAHVAPEIVTGAEPDARSDIYSLASTCYELLTGAPPLVRPGDDTATALLRIGSGRPPPLGPSVAPPAFADAIAAALSRSPDARPASAADFGQRLAGLRDIPSPTNVSPPTTTPPGNRATPASGSRPIPPTRTPPTPAMRRPAPPVGAPRPAAPAPTPLPAPWSRRPGPGVAALVRRLAHHQVRWAAVAVAVVLGGGCAGWGLTTVVARADLFTTTERGAVIFLGHRGAGVMVVALGDGRLASARTDDDTLLIWDPDRPDVTPRSIELDPSTPVEAVAALSDGRVALIGHTGPLQIWDPSDPGKGPVEIPRPAWAESAHVLGLLELADGTIAATTFVELWLWSVDEVRPTPVGRSLPQLIFTRQLTPQFGLAGTDLAVLPDGRVVAVVAGQVVLWNPATDPDPVPLRGRHNEASALAVTADGRVVVVGDAWVSVVDPDTGGPPVTVDRPSQPHVIPLADGRILLSEPDGLVVMDERMEPIASYRGHERPVTSATRLTDGRIASADGSGAIHVWDPASSS